VTEFQTEVAADRSAMDNYLARVDSLSAPGDMSRAQNALELVYELRDSAMTKIADKIPVALGQAGSDTAVTAIARQMRTLMASDILYAAVVRPEINGVLADNGIEGDDVPESVFLPDETKWLDEATVSASLASISGGGGGETSGIHGLGLLGTSLNGTALVADTTTAVSLEEETPEVEVEVQNQGESTENSITVSVNVEGGASVDQTISSIGAGEAQSVAIPLVPAPPSGTVTIEVEVQPVPGEQVTSNNEATYTVEFE
jgi:hypothetical protein